VTAYFCVIQEGQTAQSKQQVLADGLKARKADRTRRAGPLKAPVITVHENPVLNMISGSYN